MSVQGKGQLSYKKKNVQESNSPHTGFKNITFAHEFAAADETFIPFSSLSQPSRWSESGLSNPDSASLLNAQLQAFRSNITVSSSIKGLIQKEEYIVYNNRIEFKDFVSEINEVFEVEVSDVMISGNLIVDMRVIRVEGELADTQVQFNMGNEFDVNDEEIIVFRDGLQMFRSNNNESSGTTGNYYYLDTGNGRASVIEFFEPAVGSEAILIASTGGRVDNPNVSTFQEIEKLQGQIDAMVPTVASLAGVPETDFQSSPNRVDLKAFGDQLINTTEKANNNEADIATIQDDIIIDWQEKQHSTGNITSSQIDITALRWVNLEVGKTYRLTTQQYTNGIGNGQQVEVAALHGGVELTGTRFYHTTAGTANFEGGDSRVFTATTTTIETNVNLLNGDSVALVLRTQLEELPNHNETSKWT